MTLLLFVRQFGDRIESCTRARSTSPQYQTCVTVEVPSTPTTRVKQKSLPTSGANTESAPVGSRSTTSRQMTASWIVTLPIWAAAGLVGNTMDAAAMANTAMANVRLIGSSPELECLPSFGTHGPPWLIINGMPVCCQPTSQVASDVPPG
jgi:hypothetical protein